MATDKKKLKKGKRLGKGAYGRVYEAEDENEQLVVVKRNINPNWCGRTTLSVREWSILREVESSPFCIGLKYTTYGNPFATVGSPIGRDEVDDPAYFVMECGNMDGKRFLKGNPSFRAISNFLLQTALGLEFLHSRGIIHRDLKPDNIIVFLDGDLPKYSKIADFGISEYYCMQNQPLENVVTEWYRAPEILLGKHYDYRSDVWSFACVVYEVIVGKALLCECKGEDKIMQHLVTHFLFPEDDFYLLRDKYPRINLSYHYHRSNASGVDGLWKVFPNSFQQDLEKRGVATRFRTMLHGLFEVDPAKRWSITQFLNDPFFDTSRNYIDFYRARCQINQDGCWFPRPKQEIIYAPGPGWQAGTAQIMQVFKRRGELGIRNWYSHRICFHTLNLFNILSTRILYDKMGDSELKILVNCLFFIMAKFFRTLMEGHTEMKDFILDVYTTREGLEEMEHHLLHKFLVGRVYYPTLYEEADIYLSERQVEHMLQQIVTGKIPSGTDLRTAWKILQEKLKDPLFLQLVVT
ncbi:MAG: serine/threonine-protein kinase [Nitrososphaerales archaeon]